MRKVSKGLVGKHTPNVRTCNRRDATAYVQEEYEGCVKV
jgi:hypothetical protein